MKGKYSEWCKTHSFDNCGVNRGEYGRFLKSYIIEEKNGFVLNLNGAWGSGKTEFLKRMYSELLQDDYPVIYIDAWESDFSNEPLSVVSSEILNQLSLMCDVTGEDLDKVKEYLGKFLKGAVIGTAGLLSKFVLGDSSAGIEATKAIWNASPTTVLDKIKDGYSEQIEAIKLIRIHLEGLAKALQDNHAKELPVIVLVDELDRCRPNYAIELLEVIKHFYTTKNFVFLIATDTEQLKCSIKAIYGDDFNSGNYLKRFFNREARLDKPDLTRFLQQYDFSTSEKVILYPEYKNEKSGNIQEFLSWIAQAYGLELRDIDQLIGKLNACLRLANKKALDEDKFQIINILSLGIALVEFDLGYESFSDRGTNNPLNKWEGNNFDVGSKEGDMLAPFSDVYSLNMDHSVLHEYRREDVFGDTETKLVRGFENPNFRNSVSSSSPVLLRKLDYSIANTLKHYFRNNKIWLWSDYQRVVRLAGHIE